MNRRGFLGSILALGAAPAIVRADSLMRIVPRDLAVLADYEEGIFTPTIVGMPFDQITREAMRIAHQSAKFINAENAHYTRVGNIVIRTPNRYTR